MVKNRAIVSVTSLVVALLILGFVLFAGRKTKGQDSADYSRRVSTDQWEYLAVAGPSNTNLTPTGNSAMRKESNSSFAREGFVLEQHLDKLGAKGWELVAVAGPPTDPVYYFRRRK
jgi:hypothetical protein